jgi:dipeptidyl aminopeptidase/acylaminoacyl peptidase
VEDSLIPVAQAIKMRETLQRRGNPVTMKLYEGAGHNFVLRRGPAEVRDDSLRLAVDFLRKTLPAAKPPAAQALKEERAPSASLAGAGG